MSNVYEFTETFQEKILAMLWRDATFFTLYQEVVKPKYFEKDIHIDLARIIFDFYKKYETTPSLEAMLEEVRELCTSSKVKKEKLKDYVSTVDKLVDMNLDDLSYVRDKVVSFGQKQALTEAILESVEDINKGTDFAKVRTRIEEATQVGVDLGDLGTDYFDTIDERMESYTRRETEKIKTGIDSLDKLMGGGLGRGELGIVIAPPGTGKTLSLVNFGHAGVMSGKNVAHFSFEMSEERVAQRYDRRFTEKTFEYIRDNKGKVAEALKRLSKAKRGKLRIKAWPTRTATITMIKSYLTKLRIAEGFVPDLIILDYPDIMRPERTYGEKRHELELLYEDCRALGQEFNCAVWGASQANRGSLSKKVVTMADIAESFGKMAVCDFAIAISQTKEEKRNGEVRYYVAKHRDGTSDETAHCDIDYATMKITSNTERETSFDVDEEISKDKSDDWEKRKERVRNIRKRKQEKEENEDSVASEILNKVKKEGKE